MAVNKSTRYPGRWAAANSNYPLGVPKNRTSATSNDGSYFEKDWISDYEAFFGAVMTDAGDAPNGTVDTAQSSQLYQAMQKVREVEPRNNDWNGYLDPAHQVDLPAPNGYPGNSGGGEVSYAADNEISYGIFAGTGGSTVSSDSDGWIFTGSIYKLFKYTSEQLAEIDINTVPIYLKDQSGTEHFVNNSTTGVTVSKVGSNLKVELSNSIFSSLGITKLWRFFVTENLGRVVEIDPVTSAGNITARIIKSVRASGYRYNIYSNGMAELWLECNASVAGSSNPFPISFSVVDFVTACQYGGTGGVQPIKAITPVPVNSITFESTGNTTVYAHIMGRV